MPKTTIKNINLYPINHKFNINIGLLKIPDTKINFIPTNDSIYRYSYKNNYLNQNNAFFFNASLLNAEIVQFIRDMNKIVHIYILKDQDINNNILHNIGDVRIVEVTDSLINKQLYSDAPTVHKINRIVYFHKNTNQSISTKLEKLLYPNTNLPINIFDGSNIKHPLSVGSLDELQKKKILYESMYYLHENDYYYVSEAILAGCKCLNIDDEQEDIFQQINKQYIDVSKYQNTIENSIDYLSFLMDIIYEK